MHLFEVDTEQFYQAICGLIHKTSTDLPADVQKSLNASHAQEEVGSVARSVLGSILKNVELSCRQGTPICQDTGFPSIYFHVPPRTPVTELVEVAKKAVSDMVEKSVLRPNAVDSITGENPGNCIGKGIPYFNVQEWDKDYMKVDIILKGGGSENVSAQYSLPYSPLGAGRDLKGVEKVVLDAVFNAQGKGCSPGIVGVCIGSDRANGYAAAKKALFSGLESVNPDPEIAELEKRIVSRANELGIGPMGFGGKTTLLGAKVVVEHRHPASFFVSVAYNCWAYRRRSMKINGKGEISYD